jgi:PKD repeat protein
MGNPSKNVVANYFVESYNITFTTVVHAAGMDLVSYASEGTVDITIYGPGGVVLGTTTAPATNAGTFWGVSSDQPITRININSEGGQAEGVDNVAFGFVAIAPPMITFDVTVTAPCNTTVVNEGVAMCGNVTAPFAAATDIWGEADIEVIAPPLWAELCPTSTEVITFTICNVGDCDLNWELHEMTPTLVLAGSMPFVPVNVAGQGLNPGLTAASPQVQPVAVPAASPHDVLWDQPLSTANQGAYVNQEFPDVPTFSSFLADDFVSADGWIINSIFIPGDGWNGFSTLLNATGLTWQIYADNAGVPDGDPSGGGNPPVWTLTLPPNDPQVVLTNGTPGGMPSNAQLNLAAPVNLPVGHWWLVFYPTLNFSGGGQYGRQPADTTNGYTGQFINPGGGFGYGTVWQAWTILGPTQTDIAFRIEGTIVIPYPDFPWVSESPLTGTLPPGGCTVVDVTFDSTGYPPGNYFADLLIVSNDPIEPEITLPMTMTVDTPAYINDVTTGINGLTVAFTSTVVGTPPISYMWDFGDGNTSTDPNPIHTYAAGGCYTYTLNIANGCGTDNWAGQVCVCDPVHDADFTWNPPTPIVGEVAYFTATAAGTGPITYDWAFGDSATGTGQYVNHAYAAAGTYTVVMTATGECGFQVVSHDVTVASGCVAPDGADFTWVPITPTAGANVDFSGSVMTGTSPLTFDWQFSDGGTASGQNVTHVFANPGTYVVTMTVSNGCGDDTMVHTVVVAGVCEPVSNTAFTWSPPSPLVGENVTFNATADGSPVIVFAWAFGDGATDSGATVVHAYAAEGSYDVVVTATNGCGEETVLHTVTVVSGCVAPAGADFTWLPPNPVVGQAVSFHGTLGAGTSPLFYTWTFGDGSGASGSLTPSYIYATAGTFTVTLTVTNTCGTADVSHPITVQPVVTGYFIYLPLVYKAATP